MPDEPVWQEFGELCEGTKTSDEIFNARYGTYQESWGEDGSNANSAAQFDPKPFQIGGEPKE